MSLAYTSRRGDTYYLQVGPKKGGGVQHYFSKSANGNGSDAVPEGFEIYETVNGQVYLRRKKPSLILESEVAAVQRVTHKRAGDWRCKLEVRDEQIIIHESRSDYGWVREVNPWLSPQRSDEIAKKCASYMPVMRFVLDDKEKRLFAPERYCFRGSVSGIRA